MPSADPSVTVAEATDVTPELVAAFARLVPQLSRSSPPPARAELEAVVASPGTTLLVGRGADGEVLGTLTLVVFRIPTGLRALVEDVVVDESGRGRGVGTALTTAALARARQLGCRTVELTSRPTREEANRLYQHLGFVRRETNVYRYEIPTR